jgi:hypothetical protein
MIDVRTSVPPSAPPVARRAFVCIVSAAALASGCRLTLLEPPAPAAIAPVSRSGGPTVRTIPVEILFIRHDEHDTAIRDELWRFIDEQAVPVDQRRRLNANGLRAGIVDADLPEHLAARLDPPDSAAAEPAGGQKACERRTLRLLPGGRGEIVVAAPRDEMVVLEHRDGVGTGATFRDASGLFDIRLAPAADGRVRITLTPEIGHGPRERTWVGEEGSLRMEAGQKRHRRDDLGIVLDLAPPTLLVVAASADHASTLGDALFRDASPSATTHRLLVIRPLARSVDPMFAPDVAATPTDQPAIRIR